MQTKEIESGGKREVLLISDDKASTYKKDIEEEIRKLKKKQNG